MMTEQNHPIDIEVALQIYLNGFQSGVATSVKALRKDIDHGVASQFAAQLCDRSIKADPVAMEAIRDQIRAHMNGTNTGPTVLKVYNWDDNLGSSRD